MSVDGRMRNALESAAPRERHNVSEVLISLREGMSEAREIFVLTKEGSVAASSEPENAGKDCFSAEYFVQGQKSFFAGDVVREPDGRMSWVMSAPIRNATADRVLGVLAVRLDPRVLSDLTSGRRVLRRGGGHAGFPDWGNGRNLHRQSKPHDDYTIEGHSGLGSKSEGGYFAGARGSGERAGDHRGL